MDGGVRVRSTAAGDQPQEFGQRKFCVMSLKLMTRPRVEPTLWTDTPDDIAEMMAEAARVDAMFQSGAISTLFPYGLAAAAPSALAELDSSKDDPDA